jgi:cytoskeletal protein RodZ
MYSEVNTMNDNEKRKLDSIIIRIALIVFLGIVGLQVWQNVAEIAQPSYPSLQKR